jgi:hypothetical protein
MQRNRIQQRKAARNGKDDSSTNSVPRAHVGFGKLARIVSKRWKKVDGELKKDLAEKAHKESLRYQRKMKEWKAKQRFSSI